MLKKLYLLKIVFIVLFVLLFLSCASTNNRYSYMMAKAKVQFTGQDIKEDLKSGLIVSGTDHEKHPVISVGSPYYGFVLYLPYSETWELESGTGMPLFAKDNQYIVSMNIGTASTNTPKEYYKQLLENLRNSGEYLIQNVEEINVPYNNNLILRYQGKMMKTPDKFQSINMWKWNYWIAVLYKSKWYSVHLSILDEKQEQVPSEDKKIVYALSLFKPGFFDKK